MLAVDWGSTGEAHDRHEGADFLNSFFWGLLGGFVAWALTTAVAQPFRQFLNLRTEAARLLALYEDRFDPGDAEAQPAAEWLAKRAHAYETCGAELIGFAFSNSTFTRTLHRLPIKSLQCYPRNAGSSLMGLSSARPGTGASDQFRRDAMSALRLKYRP